MILTPFFPAMYTDALLKQLNYNIYDFSCIFSPSGCCGGPHEKRLLGNLLDKYNTLERPVFNESEPVVVSFGLTLMQIIDVVRICIYIYSSLYTYAV